MASSIDVTLTPDADESLRRFVHSLPETFEQGGRVIYRQRNEIRVFDLPDGRQINVMQTDESATYCSLHNAYRNRLRR